MCSGKGCGSRAVEAALAAGFQAPRGLCRPDFAIALPPGHRRGHRASRTISLVGLYVNVPDLRLLGATVAFGYAFRVGLTQQNAKTIIRVSGDPLPVGLARSRRQPQPATSAPRSPAGRTRARTTGC